MQAKMLPLNRRIEQALWMKGPVVFIDTADATSSGATGDSNAILAALVAADYPGTVLRPSLTYQQRREHLVRSSLHRCLQPHGISHLPDVEGKKPG